MSKKNYTFDTVVRCGGHTFLLAAQNNQTFSPLSQQAKDLHYPGIDLLPDYKIFEEYDCDIIKLKATETANRRKKCLDRSSRRERQDAIRTLCTLPSHVADPHYGYSCLMIALLGRILPFVPQSIIARSPSVFCGSLLQVPIFLQLLLSTVNGPEWLHGESFTLCRPSCLDAQRPFPRSAAVSHTPHDYTGGTLHIHGEAYRFWIPLWNRAICISPSLPPDIQKSILDASFSVIPFYCNSSKGTSVWDICIPATSLLVEDASVLDSMENYRGVANAILDKFFRKYANTPERVHLFFDDIDALLPSIHLGKLITGTLSAESRILAAGLCVYRAFLTYMRDKGWIHTSEYTAFLSAAQDALFPQEETVPTSTSVVVGDWNSPSAFWPFLSQFLREHSDHIAADTPCSADTVAAIHTLRGEKDALLILPRFHVESAYHEYCAANGLFSNWSGADLTNCVLEWNIGAKEDKKDGGWPYHFYRPGNIPVGQKRRVICLGIPVKNLPSEIQEILPQA